MSLKQTCVLSVIDGYMRQPDLCLLLDEYANKKIEEYEIIKNLKPKIT